MYSQVSKRRVNITYSTVEVIDFLLQFDEEDIGEVLYRNDSSDSREYERTKTIMLQLPETMSKVKILIESNKVTQLKSPKSRGQRKNVFLRQ